MLRRAQRLCNDLAIWHILLLAVALRLAVTLAAIAAPDGVQRFSSPDTDSYRRPAEGLVYHHVFGTLDRPEIHRTPGYPLLMVPGTILGQLELVTVGLQVILSVLTVYLVYCLGLALLPTSGWAKFCALLYAFEPLSIVYSCKLLSETLFTCLLVAFLLAMVHYLGNNGRWRELFFAAFVLMMGVFVRPIGYFLPVCVAAGLFVVGLMRQERRWMIIAQAIVFFAVTMSPILGWQLRNRAVAQFPRFSAIEDVNLYFYNAAAIDAKLQGVSLVTIQKRLGYCDDERYYQLHPEQADWTPSQRAAYLRSEAIKKITQHPGTYAMVHVRGWATLLLGSGFSEWVRLFGLASDDAIDQFASQGRLDRFRSAPFLMLGDFALIAICILGILLAARSIVSQAFTTRLPVVFLIATAGYFVTLAGGPAGYSRTRHPIMPIIAVLATQGLYLLTSGRTIALRPKTQLPLINQKETPKYGQAA
jgi:hypothetical protein